jgi:hypothetical protein
MLDFQKAKGFKNAKINKKVINVTNVTKVKILNAKFFT